MKFQRSTVALIHYSHATLVSDPASNSTTRVADVRRWQVERALESGGMTPEKVQELKENNWTFFLRHCRRLVPERKRLLKRFDLVINQFKHVVDSKSGEELLRPEAAAAAELLRKHISIGCLSDPEGVPLYYTTGTTAAGVTTRRCVRGTNSTEVNLCLVKVG